MKEKVISAPTCFYFVDYKLGFVFVWQLHQILAGTVVSCWQAKICTRMESKPAGQATPVQSMTTGQSQPLYCRPVQSAVILA